MATALEWRVRQLAHAQTGDKLVCPRNGELQQGSSGAVWNKFEEIVGFVLQLSL